MQLMTQAEFARHRGVSKPAVSNWKKAGHLVLAEGPGGKPMVDVQRTELKLNAKIDPMRGRPSTGGAEAATLPLDSAAALSGGGGHPGQAAAPGDRTLNAERMDQVREQRIGNALKNAQLAGDLVPLAEAERRVSEVGRAARDRIHAMLRSLAERFAAEKDVRTIMLVGEEAIDQVFDELADAALSGAFAGHDADDLTAEQELAEDAEIEAAIAVAEA